MGLDVAMVALSAIGTGVKAVGEYQAGQSTARTLNANANIADRAAADAVARGQEEAAYAFQAGGEKAAAIGYEAEQIGSAQVARYGAAGVDSTQGSAADVQVGSKAMAQRDIRKAKENAALEARMAKVNAAREAWGYQAQAENLRRQARDAQDAGVFGAIGSTVLGSIDLLTKLGRRG